MVVGLVILKSLADRGYQRDRDLLEAFLEYIPDNVFFKDRGSRFVRISRAMAVYCGLADPGQAVHKTDLAFFLRNTRKKLSQTRCKSSVPANQS